MPINFAIWPSVTNSTFIWLIMKCQSGSADIYLTIASDFSEGNLSNGLINLHIKVRSIKSSEAFEGMLNTYRGMKFCSIHHIGALEAVAGITYNDSEGKGSY